MFIVCCVLVHCRVGSLEMQCQKAETKQTVHCRVGSLEKIIPVDTSENIVHCRVGSLEIGNEDSSLKRGVHFSK